VKGKKQRGGNAHQRAMKKDEAVQHPEKPEEKTNSDRQSYLAIAVSILLAYLISRTPVTIVVAMLIVFGFFVYSLWDLPILNRYPWYRWSGIIILAGSLSGLGWHLWPEPTFSAASHVVLNDDQRNGGGAQGVAMYTTSGGCFISDINVAIDLAVTNNNDKALNVTEYVVESKTDKGEWKSLKRIDPDIMEILIGPAFSVRQVFAGDLIAPKLSNKSLQPGETVRGWLQLGFLSDDTYLPEYRIRFTDNKGETVLVPVVQDKEEGVRHSMWGGGSATVDVSSCKHKNW